MSLENFSLFRLFSMGALVFLASCSGPHMPLDRAPEGSSMDTAAGAGGGQGGKSSAGPTFLQDVAPVFEKKCSKCHAQGGGLPYWGDYKTTFKKQDRLLARVVSKKDMPPSYATTTLSDSERALIGKWLEAGAPLGESSSVGAPPTDDSTAEAPSNEIGQIPAESPNNMEPIPVSDSHTSDNNQSLTPYFTTDIAPIFEQKCTQCHVQGGGLPYWGDYKTAFDRKDRLQSRVITLKEMPPSYAAPLTSEEKALISNWLTAGAPLAKESSDEISTPAQASVHSSKSETLSTPEPTIVQPEVQIEFDHLSYDGKMREWFKTNCAICHDGTTPGMPNWQNFNEVKDKLDRIYDRTVLQEGTERSMPPYGIKADGQALSHEDILVLKAWLEAGAPEFDNQ